MLARSALLVLDSSYFNAAHQKLGLNGGRMRRAMIGLFLFASSLLAQNGAKNGQWLTYGGDLGNTHYSPLDQIDAGNFSRLQVAWRLKTDNFGPRPETNLQSTPLMVKGVLYTTAGTRRAVVAVNAATGE